MSNSIEKHWFISSICIIVISILFIHLIWKLVMGDTSSSSNSKSSYEYSNYHKCEYSGCTNYASRTKYCSKHTTYSKCAKSGCSNHVSYSGARYCAKHELELYSNK